EGVGVLDVDGLTGLGHAPGDAAPVGDANLLVIEAGGHDRPQLVLLAIGQKDGAALGVALGAGDLQDAVQQLRQIEGRVQQQGGFEEPRKLGNGFLRLLRRQRLILGSGCVHAHLSPDRLAARRLLTAVARDIGAAAVPGAESVYYMQPWRICKYGGSSCWNASENSLPMSF